MDRRWVRLIVIVVGVAGVAALPVGLTLPGVDPSRVGGRAVVAVPPGSAYVALGSSFAAGPGLPPVADEGCRRSAANYPQQVAAALDLVLTDVTCSGTTTDNILTKPHDANGTEVPPQIEALGPDTALVTITIGGNDIAYATTMTDLACVDAGECPGLRVDRDTVAAYTAEIEQRLVLALEAVRAAAPGATVVLVTYPQVMPPDGRTCAEIALTPENAVYGAGLERLLRDASVAAARRTGVTVVDAHAGSAGRDACSGRDAWIGGYPGVGPGVQAFHPTEAGMAGQAILVVDALGG